MKNTQNLKYPNSVTYDETGPLGSILDSGEAGASSLEDANEKT